MISVIIPTHNYGKYIAQCLRSIKNQTKKVDEIIVVDDASTDNTEQEVKKFRSVRYFKVKYRQADKTRNFGIKRAKGNLIMFFDGDDYMRKDTIEKLFEALQKNRKAAFAYSDRKDLLLKGGKMIGWERFRALPWDYERLKYDNFVASWALIRKKYLVPFDEKLHRLQDWDLWLRIAKRAPGVYVPEMLTRKRIHLEGITGSGPDSLLSADAYVRKKHNLPKMSFMRMLKIRLGAIKTELLGRSR